MAFDLDQDRNAALANFGNKLKEQAAAIGVQPPVAQPTNIQNQPTQAPVAATAAPLTSPAPVVAPTTTEPKPVAQAPTEPVVAPDKTTTTEPTTVEEVKEKPWDEDLIPAPPAPDQPLTIEALSTALKVDGIKSQSDLVARFTAQEAKIQELETAKASAFEGLGEDLKEVLKIAQSGGNWKQYLSTRVVDFSKAEPTQLFAREMEKSPRFKKADGSVDFDAVDAELAQIPLAVQETQGELIKNQLITNQLNQRNQLFQETEQRRAQFHNKVAEAAKKLPEILSKDKFGITTEPKHADFLYNGIRSGELVEKHLGKIDVSGVNPEKLARTLALAEWGERISKHQFSQGVVHGKKELLNKAQNVQLQGPLIPTNPTPSDQKVETAADKMRRIVNHQRPVGSL